MIIIAIDPDREKSGVCYLSTDTKKIEASSMSFVNLMSYFNFLTGRGKSNAKVIVEAGWMVHKTNYHAHKGGKSVGEKIAYCVGANHETGKKIVEMAKYYELEVQEVHPLPKSWKGKDGKITHEELNRLLTNSGINGMLDHTNQDMRDAILLAVMHSNLPLRYSYAD